MNSYNITKEYVITPCNCNIALDCSYIDMYLEKAEEELSLFLEYAIMKCLNLIGQCEGPKSLRATVRGLYM